MHLTAGAEAEMMVEILKDLRLDKPEVVLKKYPHELSGGMRQRISIAMAIVEKPRLLILDEVTTGLDVYVQNRILTILKDLNKRTGTTMILITHDLTVASQICDRLCVMYAGRVMEEGKAEDVLNNSRHPYTQKLMAAIPQGFVDSPPLPAPTGEAPDLRRLPAGCKFHPRCPFVMPKCKETEPPIFEAPDGARVALLVGREKMSNIVEADGLTVTFRARGTSSLLFERSSKTINAVDDVSFQGPGRRNLRVSRGNRVRKINNRQSPSGPLQAEGWIHHPAGQGGKFPQEGGRNLLEAKRRNSFPRPSWLPEPSFESQRNSERGSRCHEGIR